MGFIWDLSRICGIYVIHLGFLGIIWDLFGIYGIYSKDVRIF